MKSLALQLLLLGFSIFSFISTKNRNLKEADGSKDAAIYRHKYVKNYEKTDSTLLRLESYFNRKKTSAGNEVYIKGIKVHFSGFKQRSFDRKLYLDFGISLDRFSLATQGKNTNSIVNEMDTFCKQVIDVPETTDPEVYYKHLQSFTGNSIVLVDTVNSKEYRKILEREYIDQTKDAITVNEKALEIRNFCFLFTEKLWQITYNCKSLFQDKYRRFLSGHLNQFFEPLSHYIICLFLTSLILLGTQSFLTKPDPASFIMTIFILITILPALHTYTASDISLKNPLELMGSAESKNVENPPTIRIDGIPDTIHHLHETRDSLSSEQMKTILNAIKRPH